MKTLTVFFVALGLFIYLPVNGKPAYNRTDNLQLTLSINEESILDSAGDNRFNKSVYKVNIRAVRHFIKRFDNAESAVWHKIGNGYIANILVDSIVTTVAYNGNGTWLYTARSYKENKMPPDVRKLVKGAFYRYDITGVMEIKVPENQHTIYKVHVMDESIFKVLRVCNGEIEIIHDYIKG